MVPTHVMAASGREVQRDVDDDGWRRADALVMKEQIALVQATYVCERTKTFDEACCARANSLIECYLGVPILVSGGSRSLPSGGLLSVPSGGFTRKPPFTLPAAA